LPNTYQILSNILLSRLTAYVEEITGDHQFRRKISTTAGHLFCILQIFVTKLEAVYHLFTDFTKAYDSVRSEVLYNILIEFGVPMKLVRLRKTCLNETYSRVQVGKHLSDMFPIRNHVRQLPPVSKTGRSSIEIAFQL